MRARGLLFGAILAGGAYVAAQEATNGEIFCHLSDSCTTTEIQAAPTATDVIESPTPTSPPTSTKEQATFQEVKDYWAQRHFTISDFGMVVVKEGVTTECYGTPIDYVYASYFIAQHCGTHFFMIDYLATGHADQSNIDDYNTLTIAHESGHEVQYTAFDMGIALPRPSDPAFELQADCLAGNFYRGTNRNTDGAVQFYNYLGQIASDDSHGSTEERIDAFMQGVQGADCFQAP